VNTIETPAPRTISIDQLEQMPAATNPQVGDIVVANIRARWRVCIIRKVGRVNATVECHTPSGYAEAVERGRTDHSIQNLHKIAEDYDQKADRYEAIANAIEAAIADGTLDPQLIEKDERGFSRWIHWTQLPSPLRELEGNPNNYSGETVVFPPAQNREWAQRTRNSAEAYRTTRVAEAEAWNARPVADRIADCVADVTTTKTVKLESLRAA
jgi:hypothetical protein